jgi:hypothetical protein
VELVALLVSMNANMGFRERRSIALLDNMRSSRIWNLVHYGVPPMMRRSCNEQTDSLLFAVQRFVDMLCSETLMLSMTS